jgi:hypothetical protein
VQTQPNISPTALPVTVMPEPAKPSAQIQTLVDGFRVTGVRVSSTDSKVLMNDRVYRINDTVERTHGLKLVEVNADHLVFVDEHGFRYQRNF